MLKVVDLVWIGSFLDQIYPVGKSRQFPLYDDNFKISKLESSMEAEIFRLLRTSD